MIAAPGAVCFAVPFPKNMNASRIPRPGPGFASSKNRIDLPASVACSIPRGPRIPWLIALFKNKTFAGSMKILASGNRPASKINCTPAARKSVNALTAGPISLYAISVSKPPIIPAEKLFTSISNPALTFPSISLSNCLIAHPPKGPTIIAPRNIGILAPTITPIVTVAPTTPPRIP